MRDRDATRATVLAQDAAIWIAQAKMQAWSLGTNQVPSYSAKMQIDENSGQPADSSQTERSRGDPMAALELESMTSEELAKWIGGELRSLQRQRRVTAREFAEEFPITEGQFSRWKSGKTPLPGHAAKKLDKEGHKTSGGGSFEEAVKIHERKRRDEQLAVDPEGLTRSNLIELHKVEALRWHSLTQEEQDRLYRVFCELKPRLHKPHAVVCPTERQSDLNDVQPIDVGPLLDCLASFGISNDDIKLPLDSNEYEALRGRDEQISDRIALVIGEGATRNQKQGFQGIYDYLCCAELPAPRERDVREIDAILVPGARLSHSHRVDEAVRVYSKARAHPFLVLSGQQPLYDADRPLVITEAEAMYYYLTRVRRVPVDPARVVLEKRARTLQETAMHVLPELHRLCRELGRPLSMALVTGPYQLRRLLYIIRHTFRDFGHVVGTYHLFNAATTIDLGNLLAPGTDADARRYGIGVYILEYFKLIGGRATGEF